MQPVPFSVKRALDAAGVYMHMDVRYLVRGTFWSSISQIATVASSIALSVVVSRYLPKEVYGE